MAIWSGRRKGLYVLLFLLPTIIGIMIFNIYPITLNIYTSFTNRNRFRPNPDCSVAASSVLDPLCWPVFQKNAPKGLGSPYRLQANIFQNYTDLLGTLFTASAVVAFLRILLIFVPLIIADQVNKRFNNRLTRPISSLAVWGIAIVGCVLVALAVSVVEAFNTLMTTGDFIAVVLRTILFVALRVPLTFGLGLMLALILNSKFLPGRTIFRVILFVPWAASAVAILVSLVWQFFFRDLGPINQLLLLIGVKGPVWLNDPTLAFGVVVLVDIWFSYPFFMIAILGALQSISVDQYEASEIDGANYMQQLTSITLPLIRPAVLPAAVLTSITAFQMFGTAFAITAGGPQTGANTPGATEFVMVYAFRQIFQTANYGRATAFAVLIFIMLFLATLYSMRLTRITKGAFE